MVGMMQLITDANLQPGTRVFVRMDMDVPLEKPSDSPEFDSFRLDAALPTLKFLLENGAKVVLAGHIGRPDGTNNDKLSTSHLRPYFDAHLGEGNYELLENLRFDSREKDNDPEFAAELAAKADIYVNESFATSHREHASVTGIPQLLPSYAGLRLHKETEILKGTLTEPERPLTVLIGGAKLESKKPVVSKFIDIADHILLGGLIGLDWDEAKPHHLYIPQDYIYDAENLPKDIGSETQKTYSAVLKRSKTVVWAGPMGQFEVSEFMQGTKTMTDAVDGSRSKWIAGGGDTIAALKMLGALDRMYWVSTGGSAMLEFLVKETLPGIDVLGYGKN